MKSTTTVDFHQLFEGYEGDRVLVVPSYTPKPLT